MVGDLVMHGILRVVGLVAPVDGFDHLFRAERDQHANDDDAHLTDELAPAVQRLGQVEMHAIGPQQREPNR